MSLSSKTSRWCARPLQSIFKAEGWQILQSVSAEEAIDLLPAIKRS
jgi:hypothetical protein